MHLYIYVHTKSLYLQQLHNVYIIQGVQFMLLIYWNIENAQSTRVHVLKTIILLPLAARAPHLGMGAHGPLFPPC